MTLDPAEIDHLLDSVTKFLSHATGGKIVTLIVVDDDRAHRDEMRQLLWEKHGEDVYDPKCFAVSRKPDAPAIPADALLPSFEHAPADAVVSVSVPALARALATWDEKSKDKGWPERTDDLRFHDHSRYLLGIILEQARWREAVSADRSWQAHERSRAGGGASTGASVRSTDMSGRSENITSAMDATDEGAIVGIRGTVADLLGQGLPQGAFATLQSRPIQLAVETAVAAGYGITLSLYPPSKDDDRDPAEV